MNAVSWISLNKSADGCLFVHAALWLLEHCVAGAGLSVLEHSGVFLKAAIPGVQWVTISTRFELNAADTIDSKMP